MSAIRLLFGPEGAVSNPLASGAVGVYKPRSTIAHVAVSLWTEGPFQPTTSLPLLEPLLPGALHGSKCATP